MIELKDISKVFRSKDVYTKALYNINLFIAEGEFISMPCPSPGFPGSRARTACRSSAG